MFSKLFLICKLNFIFTAVVGAPLAICCYCVCSNAQEPQRLKVGNTISSFVRPTQSQIFSAHTWRMRNVKLAPALLEKEAEEAAEKWATKKGGG